VGNETGSRRASLAACPRILATLSASPDREALLGWDDDEREIGSALRSWREEAERAGPTAEAGPAPVETKGVDDIRARPAGQGRRTARREGEKVKSNYQSDFPRIKILSGKVKYIFHL